MDYDGWVIQICSVRNAEHRCQADLIQRVLFPLRADKSRV